MNKSEFTYSNRTKIIVIGMIVFLILYALSSFSDIIDENPLYEGGFWIAILGWITSMYFDGKVNN